MAVPLRRLTSAPAPAVAAAVSSKDAAVPVHMELESSRAPFSFEISNLGKVLWKGDASEKLVSRDAPMVFPKEGVDLHVTVAWPGDSAREAVKLAVTPANDAASEKTLWGEKKVDDVLTFP